MKRSNHGNTGERKDQEHYALLCSDYLTKITYDAKSLGQHSCRVLRYDGLDNKTKTPSMHQLTVVSCIQKCTQSGHHWEKSTRVCFYLSIVKSSDKLMTRQSRGMPSFTARHNHSCYSGLSPTGKSVAPSQVPQARHLSCLFCLSCPVRE